MKISVVVPTYDRNEQLSNVLDHILQSDIKSFDKVEVIVVDDGSPAPVAPIVESKIAQPPFTLRCFRQENAGPAEARNRGLREAQHEIVLFIDDDVLVLPTVLGRHVEAHLQQPGSVIFGPYPYVIPAQETPEYRFLKYSIDKGLAQFDGQGDLAAAETVASGNLSVEKRQFPDGLYCHGLKIPAAEEYELIERLLSQKIPIYLARNITGWHLQPPTIADGCEQSYKFGLGIAEVALKRPRTLKLPALRFRFDHNRGIQGDDTIRVKVRKSLRSILAIGMFRKGFLSVVRFIGRGGFPDKILFPLYSAAISIYAAAGVRDGVKMFAGEKKTGG